jgi:diphthine-ammonia ligase
VGTSHREVTALILRRRTYLASIQNQQSSVNLSNDNTAGGNVAALFSGGKDSLYAIHLAESRGLKVDLLIHLVPTIKRFSFTHCINLPLMYRLAKIMCKKLSIINLNVGVDAFRNELASIGVDTLIAGDIHLDQHIRWLDSICSPIGINILEPLYGEDTIDLYHEIMSAGFSAKIIALRLDRMDKKWLGFTLSNESAETFLNECNDVDPLGENGEYHTVVTDCPLYSEPIHVKICERISSDKMVYLKLD